MDKMISDDFSSQSSGVSSSSSSSSSFSGSFQNSVKNSKKWHEAIDFYKLTGIVFLWISAWIFMIPHSVDVNTPFFDNIWGAFFSVFGLYRKETSTSQQLPDLMSGLFSLLIMIVLQMRGIFSVVGNDGNDENRKSFRAIVTFLNILSILVHALFFSIMVKIFLFPETGAAVSIYDRMKENLGITVFVACSVGAMVFAVPSVSKLFLVLLFAVGIFKNISLVSGIMGVSGFVAVLFAAVGFYLEFASGSFDKESLLFDLSILSGRYKTLLKDAESESENISGRRQGVSSAQKIRTKKSLLKKAELLNSGKSENYEKKLEKNSVERNQKERKNEK